MAGASLSSSTTTLAHRHHIVIGDRIRLHFQFERVRQRRVAGDCGRDTRIMCWADGLGWRGADEDGLLGGRTGEPVHFADHRVPGHISIPPRSGWRKAGFPEFLNCSTRSSVQVNTVIALFLRFARPFRAAALRSPIPKFPAGETLSLAGRCLRARAF